MRLDVVIPAHNEQHRIGRTLLLYGRCLSAPDVRLLVALDGCSDATSDVVRAMQADDDRIELLEFPKLGKGGVIAESFRHASGEIVAFVDADCATPPDELLRLVDAISQTGADGAIASRRHPAAVLPRRRQLVRRVTAGVYMRLVRRLFGLRYHDTQCGAKALRQDAAQRILPYLSSRDLVFDVDLLLVARALGLRVLEVPTIWIDRDGSRVQPVSDSAKMAGGLLRLWLQHRLSPVRHV